MFVFDYDSDESLTIYFNGKKVVNVNHDEDGWAGMAKVRDGIQSIARECGIPVVVKGDVNV